MEELKKGDFVETRRFYGVRLQEVYGSLQEAWNHGYKEEAYARIPGYGVLGKNAGNNLMVFAAYKK